MKDKKKQDEYYLAHRDELLEYQKAYRLKQKELSPEAQQAIKEKRKSYYLKHREKRLAYQKVYNDSEEYRAYQRAYQKKYYRRKKPRMPLLEEPKALLGLSPIDNEFLLEEPKALLGLSPDILIGAPQKWQREDRNSIQPNCISSHLPLRKNVPPSSFSQECEALRSSSFLRPRQLHCQSSKSRKLGFQEPRGSQGSQALLGLSPDDIATSFFASINPKTQINKFGDSYRQPRSNTYQYKLKEGASDISTNDAFELNLLHEEPTPEALLLLQDAVSHALWNLLLPNLTDTQKEIIKLTLSGYTQQEISNKLGTNQSSTTKSLFGNVDYHHPMGIRRYGGVGNKLKKLILLNQSNKLREAVQALYDYDEGNQFIRFIRGCFTSLEDFHSWLEDDGSDFTLNVTHRRSQPKPRGKVGRPRLADRPCLNPACSLIARCVNRCQSCYKHWHKYGNERKIKPSMIISAG